MRLNEAYFRAQGVKIREFAARPDVKRAGKIAQRILLVLIVAYLIYQLTNVGWGEVIGALPENPWFYAFFLLRFLALPVSEIAIYEMIWRRPLIRHFTVFIRKRVYNYAVLGYSGEVFLTSWARRTLGLPDRTVLGGVKDNNLLSAFTSNVTTVILIVALAVSGRLQVGLEALPGAAALFALAFTSASTLAITVFSFRRRLTSLTDHKLVRLLSVHSVRQLLIMILHAAMYASALPDAPLMAWVTFITLQLVISRIPFLPNQDLVFLGAALALSSIVGASEAAVAGMLIAEAGLSQLVNFGLFFGTAHIAGQSRRTLARDKPDDQVPLS